MGSLWRNLGRKWPALRLGTGAAIRQTTFSGPLKHAIRAVAQLVA